MSIRTVNIASTSCCGLIQRSYDCSSSETSETGWIHSPGGDYAPGPEDFEDGQILEKLARPGICPDCGKSILPWLNAFGHFSNGEWRYDYNLAQDFWNKRQKKEMLYRFLMEADVTMQQAEAIMKM